MNYKEQIKKENIKNYYKNKSKNKSIINQYYKKINDNIINQIFNSITKRTYKTLLRQNVNKKYTYLELLGCNLLEFELYLLDKLTDGMTFDNYGVWEIDNIFKSNHINVSETN